MGMFKRRKRIKYKILKNGRVIHTRKHLPKSPSKRAKVLRRLGATAYIDLKSKNKRRRKVRR